MNRSSCLGSVHASLFRWADVVTAAVMVGVATRLHLTPSGSFDPLMMLSYVVVIVVVHELGHAAAAILVGHRVVEVCFGAGSRIGTWLGRSRLAVGLLPTGGHVLTGCLDPSSYRWKRLFVIGAGPGTNAVMFAIVVFGDAPSGTMRDFAIANLFVLVGNLLPFSVKMPYGPQRSDGLALFHAAIDTDWELAEERSTFAVAEATLAGQRQDWEDAQRVTDEAFARNPRSRVLRGWIGTVAVTSGEYAVARAVFRELVDEDRRTPLPIFAERDSVSRAAHLNDLAWSDLMLEDPDLMEEALEASARALELLPEHPAIRGTRAYALIVAGRPGDGIDLGLAAYAKTKEARGRALQASVLAIGYARDWRFPQAERWIGQARRWDPDCPLLDRARAELHERRRGGDGAAGAAVESR